MIFTMSCLRRREALCFSRRLGCVVGKAIVVLAVPTMELAWAPLRVLLALVIAIPQVLQATFSAEWSTKCSAELSVKLPAERHSFW